MSSPEIPRPSSPAGQAARAEGAPRRAGEADAPRQSFFSEPREAAVDEYRALSATAVIGLVLGLLSPLALLTPLLWFVPLAAIVVSVWALQRIAEESPTLIGRKAALAGLLLAVLCGAAAPTEWAAYRWLVAREARPFAKAFLDFLAHNEPHKAYQLTVHPASRQPFNDKLWSHYLDDWTRYRDLQDFVRQPAIRVLLASGDQARVRYYATDKQQAGAEGDQLLHDVYAVTYDDPQGKKTFFVRLLLQRLPLPTSGQSFWVVKQIEGGVKPVCLGGEILRDPGPPKVPENPK